MTWKRKQIFKQGKMERYEYQQGKYTIDISIGSIQGYPASNHVQVLGGRNWGGFLLGTPKNFRTKAQVNKFVKFAKKELNAGRLGKKIPFRE